MGRVQREGSRKKGGQSLGCYGRYEDEYGKDDEAGPGSDESDGLHKPEIR